MNSEQAYQSFLSFFERHPDIRERKWLAGVSGGPDSMALCHMMARACSQVQGQLYAVTVDHGLRTESAEEAKTVSKWIGAWNNVEHTILEWEGSKPKTRIMEEARRARFNIMGDMARKKCIKHIFLAHQLEDQAETFLMRLAKGSGLDGLSAMREVCVSESLTFCRPLLRISKEDLISYCNNEGAPYVMDPSNENQKYLRPSLRRTFHVLESEGLSARRLSVTSARLARAQEALEAVTDHAFNDVLLSHKDGEIVLDGELLRSRSAEIRLRILMKGIEILGLSGPYPPRLEKMEALEHALFAQTGFYRRTLGRFIFSVRKSGREIRINKEPKI